jgi:hypothetical protein
MIDFDLGEWRLGVGVNMSWDLIKTVYSKLKTDFDRRISIEEREFEFDWLGKIIDNTLDILAGAGENFISQTANVLHQWLVNVPDEFLRENVRAWLQDRAVRENAKVLMVRLLSGENIDELKTSLVQSYCQHTADSATVGDSAVRIVIKFIGNTIEGSISDGERVLLAKAQSTHSAVREVHESIIDLRQRLSAIPLQGGQYTSSDDQRLVRAFRLSQKAECFLRVRFKARGNGLGELLHGVSLNVRNFDLGLATTLSRFAPIRNVLMHEERPSISTAEVDRLLDEVETVLSRHLVQPPAKTSLSLPSRQWFVSADGLGEFTTISEALSHAARGDQIFILPGSYQELVSVDKPVSLIGKGESADDVIITADDDILEVGASEVVVTNLTFKTQRQHAFGVVLLPGMDRVVISQCGFAVPNGEGLAALHATGITLNDCRFEQCRVAARLDSNAIVSQCSFVQNSHGLLVRAEAASAIEKCSFKANLFDIEIRGNASVQIHDSEFQAGSYAIVAVGQPTGRIFSNRFNGYEPDSRLIKMDGATGLVFEE